MYVHYIPLRLTPDRGFCEAVCVAKIMLIIEAHNRIVLFM